MVAAITAEPPVYKHPLFALTPDMTISPTLRALAISLLLPLTALPGYGDSATAPTQAPEYLPLEQLRSFYKLMPLPGERTEGTRTVGNSGTTITFGPGKRELSIGGYRWQLSYPTREDSTGDLLISRTDYVKLFDPVLRPTYISERRVVRTVVIDPGHGGYDIGSPSDYVNEADFCLQLAMELRDCLTRRGYSVILTREQSRHLSDQQRVLCANSADAAIFISLHLNSGRSDISGIETYTATPDTPGIQRRPANNHDAASTALAFAVHSSLISATGAQDGACRRARYNLLNSIDCPAIMVLAGYATNKDEGTKLATAEYRTRLATAMADGIGTFARAINPDATLKPSVPAAEPTPPAPTPTAAPVPAKPKAKPKAKPSTGKKPAPRRTPRRRNRRR